MKFPKLLAIYISLALNCGAAFAGWHTNEPFCAWPATNHLRWTTNVGTYTNESDWRGTNGYGGWTNNYIATNLWIGPSLLNRANFPFPMGGYGYVTNYHFNAKDVRLLDCIFALSERLIAGSAGTITFSNSFMYIIDDEFGDETHSPTYDFQKMFFHNERMALQVLKGSIANYLLPYPWVIKTNETSWVNLTESLLCSNAAVPPNFLHYTPPRAADMTANAYSRILTNTVTLSTNNPGVLDWYPPLYCDENVRDSFGQLVSLDENGDYYDGSGWYPPGLIGTNGQRYTVIVTNANHAEGWPITAYGWDGLKRVITNFSLTARANTWGIGIGTNSAGSFASNGVCAIDPWITPIIVDTADDPPTAIAATNGGANWAANNPWAEPDAWSWYWSLTNPVTIIQTGAAPSSVFSASYNVQFMAVITYDAPAYNPSFPDQYKMWTCESGDGYWCFQTNYFMAYTNQWKAYSAPLRITSAGPVARRLDYFYKSNSVPLLLCSTNILAGNYGVTSMLYNASTPSIPAGFGSDNATIFSWGVGGYWPYSDGSADWLRFRYHPGGEPFSGSTNLTFPAITSHATLEAWDFEYK